MSKRCGMCPSPKPMAMFAFTDSEQRAYYVCETCALWMLRKACLWDGLRLRVRGVRKGKAGPS